MEEIPSFAVPTCSQDTYASPGLLLSGVGGGGGGGGPQISTFSTLATSTFGAGNANIGAISTLVISLDGNLLTSAGGGGNSELLLNGIPLVTTENISSLADWSLDPAISTVNMNQNNMVSVNIIAGRNPNVLGVTSAKLSGVSTSIIATQLAGTAGTLTIQAVGTGAVPSATPNSYINILATGGTNVNDPQGADGGQISLTATTPNPYTDNSLITLGAGGIRVNSGQGGLVIQGTGSTIINSLKKMIINTEDDILISSEQNMSTVTAYSYVVEVGRELDIHSAGDFLLQTLSNISTVADEDINIYAGRELDIHSVSSVLLHTSSNMSTFAAKDINIYAGQDVNIIANGPSGFFVRNDDLSLTTSGQNTTLVSGYQTLIDGISSVVIQVASVGQINEVNTVEIVAKNCQSGAIHLYAGPGDGNDPINAGAIEIKSQGGSGAGIINITSEGSSNGSFGAGGKINILALPTTSADDPLLGQDDSFIYIKGGEINVSSITYNNLAYSTCTLASASTLTIRSDKTDIFGDTSVGITAATVGVSAKTHVEVVVDAAGTGTVQNLIELTAKNNYHGVIELYAGPGNLSTVGGEIILTSVGGTEGGIITLDATGTTSGPGFGGQMLFRARAPLAGYDNSQIQFLANSVTVNGQPIGLLEGVSTYTGGTLTVANITGLSTINGQTYIPGGGGTGNTSTISVSSITTTQLVAPQDLTVNAGRYIVGSSAGYSNLVDKGSDVGTNSFYRVTAQNGNRGEISFTANPGFAGAPGEINLTANGGTPPGLALALGGVVNITANTPIGADPALTSAVKISASGINSYAGAVPSIGSLAGYNFIYGTLGVSLCAGLPASGVQIPGTVYLYGTTGITVGSQMNTGSDITQSDGGLYTKLLTGYWAGIPYAPQNLAIKGRQTVSGNSYVTLSNVTNLAFENGAITGLQTINGASYPQPVPANLVVSTLQSQFTVGTSTLNANYVVSDQALVSKLIINGTPQNSGLSLPGQSSNPAISVPIYFSQLTPGHSTLGLYITDITLSDQALVTAYYGAPFVGGGQGVGNLATDKLFLSHTGSNWASIQADSVASSILVSANLSVSSITNISSINGHPVGLPPSSIANSGGYVNITTGGGISSFAYENTSLYAQGYVDIGASTNGITLHNDNAGGVLSLNGQAVLTGRAGIDATKLTIGTGLGTVPPLGLFFDTSTILFNGGPIPASVTLPTDFIVSSLTAAVSVSTPQLFVSSVNGQIYPPPASGGSPDGLFSTLRVSSSLTAYSASISSLTNVSTINGLPYNITNDLVLSSLTAAVSVSTPELFVSSVNGALYPPPASVPSSIINGPSFVDINSSGGISTISQGRYSVDSVGGISLLTSNFNIDIHETDTNSRIVLGQTSIQTTGAIYNGTFTFLSSLTVSSINGTAYPPAASPPVVDLVVSTVTAAVSMSTPVFFVSSINGAPYPPPSSGGSPNGLFSTLQVSSVVSCQELQSRSTILLGDSLASTSAYFFHDANATNARVDLFLGNFNAAPGLTVPGEFRIFNDSQFLSGGILEVQKIQGVSSINSVGLNGGDIAANNVSAEIGFSLAGAGTFSINGSTGAEGQVIGIVGGYPEWTNQIAAQQKISSIVIGNTSSVATYVLAPEDVGTYFVLSTDGTGTPPYSVDFIALSTLGTSNITFSIKNLDFVQGNTITVTHDFGIPSGGNNVLFPPSLTLSTNASYCICQYSPFATPNFNVY